MWYLNRLSKYGQMKKQRYRMQELEKFNPSIWVYAVLLNAPYAAAPRASFKG
jgi:hypothetical protein